MDVNKSARSVSVASPILLISGEKGLLVIEKQPVCILPIQEAITIFMGVFWVFHMKYPDNYSNLFALLEILLFDHIPTKIHRKVSTVFTSLTHAH